MNATDNRQWAAETCALLCLQERYSLTAAEVATTRFSELLHLASLIRAHTDQLNLATCGQPAIDAGVMRAIAAFTAEF